MKLRVISERPPLPSGSEEEQIRALRDYLWRVSEELEYVLTHLFSNVDENIGNTATNTQDLSDHVSDNGNPHAVTASQIAYDNTDSGLSATTLQAAIDELAGA